MKLTEMNILPFNPTNLTFQNDFLAFNRLDIGWRMSFGHWKAWINCRNEKVVIRNNLYTFENFAELIVKLQVDLDRIRVDSSYL